MIQEDSLSPSSSRIRNIFEPLDSSYVADLWNSRFGIPESIFWGYLFFRKAQSVWAVNESCLPRLSYEAIGMRIMNLKDRPWKPTTSALQVFGRHAAKNVIHLDQIDARIFLEGKTLIYESNSEPGYVVVFYRGEVLGCGLYSHGKLVSQIPKERRMASIVENGACEINKP
jgi:NOL1/NOP2/fmu family ribosome biogenesis protein